MWVDHVVDYMGGPGGMVMQVEHLKCLGIYIPLSLLVIHFVSWFYMCIKKLILHPLTTCPLTISSCLYFDFTVIYLKPGSVYSEMKCCSFWHPVTCNQFIALFVLHSIILYLVQLHINFCLVLF